MNTSYFSFFFFVIIEKNLKFIVFHFLIHRLYNFLFLNTHI